MAEILDDIPDDDDNLTVDESAAKPEVTAPPPAPVEEEVPEKFKGKTPAEIAKAYHDLEQHLGRQGAELGELRKTLDLAIQASLVKRTEPTPTAPKTTDAADDTEFFTNPREAIRKELENAGVIRELREHKQMTQQERNAAMLREKHPDLNEVVGDPEFQKWVGASKVRAALFAEAHKNYNFEAGDELLSTFKELKGVKKAEAPAPAPVQKDVNDAARADALRAASVPSGNSAPMNEGNGGKPIYKRRQLMELRIHNPAKYEAMSEEITRAYLEDRVR